MLKTFLLDKEILVLWLNVDDHVVETKRLRDS